MKSFFRRALPALLSCLLLVSFSGCSTLLALNEPADRAASGFPDGEPSSAAPTSSPLPEQSDPPAEDGVRGFYTDVSAAKTATLMVYVIGSDLESDMGTATDDILEMLAAPLGENVNVVLQTGGTMEWWNDTISGDTCQRFTARDGDLALEADLGLISMGEPDALADFITWAASAYPADRYGLILWNHGGGTMMGYGYDEYFPDDMLELSDLSAALAGGGVQFDFIGFDACLMATVEVAAALEPYADYLIASEESEPAAGWNYTGWLTALAENPALPTETLGADIVSSFMDDYRPEDDPTLSVIDLRYIPALCTALRDYMDSASSALSEGDYPALAQARAAAQEYGEGEFDQIDIRDFSGYAGLDGTVALQDALDSTVVCSSAYDDGSYGLAMYFPYNYPEYYADVQAQMRSIGFDAAYFTFFNEFVNILAYGQDRSDGGDLLGGSMGGSVQDYSGYDWFDPDGGSLYEENYQPLDNDELVLDDKGDYYALSLSDEAWDTITYIEMQVLLDDGEGFIDLGRDNVYDFDEDGDLIVDFDYTWIALDDVTVPFYAEKEVSTDDYWYTYGYVPAELNGETDIEIILRWDSDHDGGYVAGYRYAEEGPGVASKGLRQFENGDEICYYCSYYTYDYEYDADYYLGDPVTYTGEIDVSYLEIGEYRTEVSFMLRDIYNNEYWTETVEFSFE